MSHIIKMFMFLGLIASLVGIIESFKVPMLFANVSESDHSVWCSLPEDHRISSVLYYTNYGVDECPAYDYKSDPDLVHPWAIREPLDKPIRISAIVETKQNEIVAETFKLNLGNHLEKERVMRQCQPQTNDEPRRLVSHHGELLFEEYFHDRDLKNWFHVVQSQLPAPHYEGVAFVSDPANSFVENNMLHLMVTNHTYSYTNPFHLKDCTVKRLKSTKRCGEEKNSPLNFRHIPPFVSAKLRSKSTFSYCRVDIVAKMPIGDLLFPGLHLAYDDGSDEDDGDDAIRIAIVRGNGRLSDNGGNEIGGSRVFAGAIYIGNKATEIHERIKYVDTNYHYGRSFHTYSVIWQKKNIVFKVDGQEIARIIGPIAEELSEKKRHIELFVTVGGEYNFPDLRVPPHQKKYSLRNSGSKLALHLKQAVEMARNWEQPEMVIKSIKVYSTGESEN